MNELIPLSSSDTSLVSPGQAPALITASGPEAERRFWEFFTVTIRNPNTRRAYAQAVREFCAFLEAGGAGDLCAVTPMHVAAYVEALGQHRSAPTVKLRLAAIRMLFDWLVTGQVIPVNPAAAVRGPKHVVRRGKTPVLARDDARRLLEAIDVSSVVGRRDRAFIGLLVYSFARVGAAVAMEVRDFHPNGRRWWVRLHEKGGKHHELPAHHNLEAWLLEYIEAAGIGEEKRAPLFRSALGRTGVLSDRPLLARNALDLVRRRAKDAGIAGEICNHTFRATGITAFLENGGALEMAQTIASHESPRTT
ncbi:MAG: tyrosine-type recombinase/integrase, partial [Pseudomonadota bacterium]